jgi:dihydrofolate reductase
MRRLSVFDQISLDGYFVDGQGDMSWAHKSDPEWSGFASENASGGGELVFGRVTYEMMASYWPSAQAAANAPVVAENMNARAKVVFSRTLERATWANTTLLKGDLLAEVRELKAKAGPELVILGSGSIVAQLTAARLIDAYQLVMVPIVLGSGRTLFSGSSRQSLSLVRSRAFENGNVVLWYEA